MHLHFLHLLFYMIELCDRIIVLSSGAISGVVDPREQPIGMSMKESIGLLMTKKTDPVANATPAETAAAIESADTAAEEGKKEDGQQ